MGTNIEIREVQMRPTAGAGKMTVDVTLAIHPGLVPGGPPRDYVEAHVLVVADLEKDTVADILKKAVDGAASTLSEASSVSVAELHMGMQRYLSARGE